MSRVSKILIDPEYNSFCCVLSSPDKANQSLTIQNHRHECEELVSNKGYKLPSTKQ